MDKGIQVFGVNDRDQESVQAWVKQEDLPFPFIIDDERSIAIAYGMSEIGTEGYLANPAEGRRPGVVINEEGLVLMLLPDLATVEGQLEVLYSLT